MSQAAGRRRNLPARQHPFCQDVEDGAAQGHPDALGCNMRACKGWGAARSEGNTNGVGRGSRRLVLVTHAVDRVDQLLVGGDGCDLLAQLLYVAVDGAVAHDALVGIDFVHELVA